MTRTYVALGGNLGDVRSRFRTLLSRLGRSDMRLERTSRLYRTVALTLPPHEPQPDYWNAVVELETRLSPFELLKALQSLEHEFEREHGARWAPRTLDLDVLLYGERVIRDKELSVPHRELTRRGFVLAPLADLIPDTVIPGTGQTVQQWLDNLDETGILGVDPDWLG